MARWVRCPISSANAQDDRTNHSLLRNSGGAHQHVEPRWITQPGADVLGNGGWVELHARLGADGPEAEGIVHDFRPFGKNVNANV